MASDLLRRGPRSDLPSWAIDWRRNVARSFIGVDADATDDRAKYGLTVKWLDLQPDQLRVERIRYFSIRSITAIRTWPEDMLKAKADRAPHALFNTMGWVDGAVVDLAPCYARCDHLQSLRDEGAVFHEPLLNAGSKSLQLFMPRTTMLDDVVVFLKGAKCLFVLRPAHGKGSSFELVGPMLGYQSVWAPDPNAPDTPRTVFRMKVTGLPSETSWQDLETFVQNHGQYAVNYIETGRYCDDEGLVYFSSANDLQNAVKKLDGREFEGATVRCKSDIVKEKPLDYLQSNERVWCLQNGVLQDGSLSASLESFVLV